MAAITQEVVERNAHLREPNGDWWVTQRISRGVDAVGDEGWEHTGPNLVIDVSPLPLASRATMYRDGAEVMTTTMRRTAPSMLSPRAKMNNYMNMIVAGQPIKTARPDAWPLLLDENGNLAEGSGSNIFVVQDGRLRTPRARYVLPGVSRQMTMDLAAKLGIPCDEADIDLYDAANAEEMFLTSTSLCILPDHAAAYRRLCCRGRLRFRAAISRPPAELKNTTAAVRPVSICRARNTSRTAFGGWYHAGQH
jgi:branched-chain amino acid aminotransferase